MTAFPNPDRIAELHRLAREDYAKGTAQRVRAEFAPAQPLGLPDPSELAAAIRVGQRTLDIYGTVEGADVFAYAEAHGALTEAVRILLRALGAELSADVIHLNNDEPPAPRCPAAHPEDPDPCSGPVVVAVLDTHQVGANGCEHHGARLLASLDGGRVYALPDAESGSAIRVFKTAAGIRPFPWVDAPRTRDDQLARDEVRDRGERP